MPNEIEGSATSPSGPTPGQNAVRPAPADLESALAAAMAPGGSPALSDNQEPPTLPATGDPENLTPPAAEGEPGQEPSPPDGTPAPDETGGGEAGQTDLSQTEPELAQALASLAPDQRTQLVGMLKDVAAGKANWGDLKRGHRLTGTIEQLKREFQEQIEALKADRETETRVAPAQTGAPETVAKLKTAAEVEARLELATNNAEALQDFLDANPGDAETRYPVGDQEFTRQQLIEKRAAWRAEMRALPRRLTELASRARYQQARTAADTQIREDFPILTDEDHPDTKIARQLLKDPRFGGEVNGEYIALAMATGHRVLQAELTARKAKGNGGGKPLGKVPLGKPAMAGAGGTPARSGPMQRFQSALPKPGQRVTMDVLENVLDAVPRP